MTYRAIDCQGFAGGFTLGVVQAGFHLVGKREMVGGFGATNCEVNRHLLGNHWETEAVDPREWTIPHGGAELVFGNPPCSGFSGLSSKTFRGVDSPINHCMWALIEYAARVRPQVIAFESVRAAYTQGRPLMLGLREKLEMLTGDSWNLYHVPHDAYAVGGPAIRRRYFWVASRIQFGVEHPNLSVIPTFGDAILDLENLGLTWASQPYRSPPSAWAAVRRSATGVVDGHFPEVSAYARRILDLATMVPWFQGENLSEVARRCWKTHGRLPDSWKKTEEHHVENDFNFGFNAIHRWREDRPARVVTGAGPLASVHPHHDRTLTHREVARVMGFPDDWMILPIRNLRGLHLTWGKGITVDAGRWLATWIRHSLDGEPGQLPVKIVGEREYELPVLKPRSSHTSEYGMLSARLKKLIPRGRTVTQETAPAFQEPEPVVVQPQEAAPQLAPTQVAQPEPAPAAQSESTELPRRGRPRPADVIKRDEQVLNAIPDGGATREGLAEATTLSETRVYQSLWRLNRDGKIHRVGRVWYLGQSEA